MQKLEGYEGNFEHDVIYAQPTAVPSGLRPYEPQSGSWRDDLCDCFSNL